VKLKKILKSSLNTLFIFETEDNFNVESVFYKGERLCVSTQVGCPVGCKFCASGMHGFFRNLDWKEIVSQYEIVKNLGFDIKGIALAGIGEPSFNVEEVKKSIEWFRERKLKVTVSTTAYPLEGFKELLRTKHNGLTISVHGFKEETRKRIFKNSERIENILAEVEAFLRVSSSSARKRIQLGYLLLKGVNDDVENLTALSETARKFKMTVMLMSYNKVDGLDFEPVSKDDYEKIFLFLRKNRVRVTLSNRYRTDKLGGCGTLSIARCIGERRGSKWHSLSKSLEEHRSVL